MLCIYFRVSTTGDRYWALKGGGGSAWGVVTSLTVRAHVPPPGGITVFNVAWSGTLCPEGRARRDAVIDGLLAWAQNLDRWWGEGVGWGGLSERGLSARCRGHF